MIYITLWMFIESISSKCWGNLLQLLQQLGLSCTHLGGADNPSAPQRKQKERKTFWPQFALDFRFMNCLIWCGHSELLPLSILLFDNVFLYQYIYHSFICLYLFHPLSSVSLFYFILPFFHPPRPVVFWLANYGLVPVHQPQHGLAEPAYSLYHTTEREVYMRP